MRLQKSLGSDSSRRKDVLQDHGVWLSRSLTFGSSAATYEGQSDCPKAPAHREPSPAGAQVAVGGSPLQNDYNQSKGSLEVKLPTIWTDEKQRWEESERREE